MSYLNNSPYSDRYDGDTDHRKAGYTRVLAKPGYAEQASEFNEIQSIARDYTVRLGNSLYTDGQIISGCGINIAGGKVTIEKGSIFLNGLIRNTDGAVLDITGSGTERIVAKVVTSVVTISEDSTLRDPAQGSENYGLEGADREKEVVEFSVVSGDRAADGSEIYHLENGEKVENSTVADVKTFVTQDILAGRTFDENGSYKIQGIVMKEPVEELKDQGKIKVYISDGKAYVAGYEVSKPSMSHILLDQSTDTRTVISESHYYSTTRQKYELSNGPIAKVNNLTCLVSIRSERKFRGSVAGGYDSLNNTPVDSITRVYTLDPSGNVDHTYVQNVDYKLYNDQIDWSLTGDDAQEPSKGTTYYVDYVYNKTMEEGVDFEVSNTAQTAYINFLNGDRPDDNTRMYISYTYTLARRDLIYLDKDGEIGIIKGQPEKLSTLITPYNGNDRLLELGYITVYPTNALTGDITDGIADVVNYNSVRFTQEDFYTMLQRIDTIEDDLATLDMEREIEEGEDTSSLNGYFTDSFKNINKSDLAYTANIDGKEISYSACIDYDLSELTTSADIKSKDLIINNSDSDNYAIYGTVISAPYVAELALQQKYATGTMLVNPYASYGPMCKVNLTPDKDNWVDENTTLVKNTVNNTSYSYSTKTYSHGYWSRNATANLKAENYMRTETKTTTTYAGKTVSHVLSSSVAATLYEFMRPITVTVEGRAFGANMEDIVCRFNDIPVSMTAIGGHKQGRNKLIDGKTIKTVSADDNGTFRAKFNIPQGVPCGTVKVALNGDDVNGDNYTGQANFSAVGTLLTTTITDTTVVTAHYNVLTEIDNLYSSDPLAQSFMMSPTYDRVLCKLGLYFASVADNRPAIVQVRNMVNGYPGETVYAEVALDPKDIKLPTNPDKPVVTEVNLNQPVYCKAGTFYCFVILSDSNKYSMYYAQMGKNILGTVNNQLVVNPYATGVMFSSSNASTWTAHQDSDLKFELYRSRYTGSGEIVFDEADVDDITGIMLDAAYQDTNNDGLDWYYKYKTSEGYSIWYPVDTLTFRDLRAVTDKVILKAVITTNFSTSPYIDISRVSLRSFIDQKEATYISTHITKDDFEEPYQALKISYQAAMPTGADHNIYYMDDETGDWVLLQNSATVDLETKTVDEEFMQYTWNVSKVDTLVKNPTKRGANFFKLRIDLTTTLAYNRPRVRKLSAIFKYD